MPHSGGRGRLPTEQQELAIVAMVVANNEIKLKEIQVRVLEDDEVFGTINAISVTTNSGSTVETSNPHETAVQGSVQGTVSG